MPWTPEEARAAASQGGKQKGINAQRRREMTPQERAMDALRNKSDKIADELVDAALGQGDFEQLDLKTRAQLLVRIQEWLVGKPAVLKTVDKPEEPEEPDGLAIA
jgi:hypothetical protein